MGPIRGLERHMEMRLTEAVTSAQWCSSHLLKALGSIAFQTVDANLFVINFILVSQAKCHVSCSR